MLRETESDRERELQERLVDGFASCDLGLTPGVEGRVGQAEGWAEGRDKSP